MSEPCPVCRQSTTFHKMVDYQRFTQVTCEGCGEFQAYNPGLDWAHRNAVPMAWLSGAIRDQWLADSKAVRVDAKFIKDAIGRGPPTFNERVERYLLEFISGLSVLTARRNAYDRKLIAATYCGDAEELKVIVQYLQNRNFLRVPQGQDLGYLSAEGHIYCDELRHKRTASEQGFVAMSFNPDLYPVWADGLKLGIEAAGYSAMKINEKDHNNDITDEIIAEIRRSKFIVADLTNHRQGVYFEAGFALGLDKPIFYTCRADQIESTHFDIRQYNCLVWNEPSELVRTLRQRIEAVIGAGPLPNS